MKKLVRLLSLVLVLLLALCVFVACNDTPDNTPDDGGKTPGGAPDGGDLPDTTQKFTATIQFIHPDTGEKLEADIERRDIVYGTAAYLPNSYVDNVTKYPDHVITGWDTDGDNIPDEGWKEVKKNLTIKAVFREKKMLVVNFYDTPTTFKGVSVKEGEAIDVAQVAPNPQIGQIFKQWINADEKDPTTLACAQTNANFVAQYAKLDSIIPQINKGVIVVDGKKEAAWADAAYLPINEEKHVDYEVGTYAAQKDFRPADKDSVIPDPDMNGAMSSWITADAWLLWDGDFIYMLVEVSDKSVSYRNPLHISQNVNPWLTDGVESYYSFEQDFMLTTNNKKLSVDAVGQKKYANSIAQLGYNSVYFAQTEGAARSAIGYFKNGTLTPVDASEGLISDKAQLEATDDVGVQYANNTQTKNYSYRVELKYVAKTEGVPDTENYKDVDENGRLPEGYELPDGTTVPKLVDKNDPANVDMKYYRFTNGENLVAGNFVRFSLQINDLMITRDKMEDKNSGFYEGDPDDATQQKSSNFFKPDGEAFKPPFAPVGHIQYELPHYVTFSLGDKNSQAKWEVYELKGTAKSEESPKKMVDANGNEIVQGSQIVTVEIAK